MKAKHNVIYSRKYLFIHIIHVQFLFESNIYNLCSLILTTGSLRKTVGTYDKCIIIINLSNIRYSYSDERMRSKSTVPVGQ